MIKTSALARIAQYLESEWVSSTDSQAELVPLYSNFSMKG
jgi:hypothetical protein